MNQQISVNVKKLEPDVKLPTYGTDGAACFDLYAYMGPDKDDDFVINSESSAMFHTGLSFEVPQGYSMDIRSRSGNFIKAGILAFPGTIDSDYRGELMIALTNTTNEPFKVYNGDRIAQALLTPVPKAIFKEVETLSETVRGAGGFGSTGT